MKHRNAISTDAVRRGRATSHSLYSRTALAVIAASLLLSPIPLTRVHAAAGDLDPSFGTGGKVTTDFFGFFDEVYAMAIQPDGQILAVGGAQPTSSYGRDFALARYNLDGSLDTTFGTGGKVTTDFLGDSEAVAVAIQTDGRIVVGGFTRLGMTLDFDFALARYNTDGTLDATFGSGGKLTTDNGTNDCVGDIVIQGDGKIVVAGLGATGSTDDFVVLRYNADGSLDSTFGVGGIVTTDFSGKWDCANSLVIQGDGRITVAGFSGTFFNDDFALARYNPDGSLDSTFGIGGKVTTEFFGGRDRIGDIALQTDGRLVVAGSVNTDASNLQKVDFAVARYNTDGSLDLTFGSAGKTLTDFLGQEDGAFALAIQSNGRIVAAGQAILAGAPFSVFALARYDTNGSLDSSFGTSGKVMTAFFGQFDIAFDVVIQSDGRIVAGGGAGSVSSGVSTHDFALARYLGDVPLQFNICLQDDDSEDSLQFNSTSGDYLFTRCGARGFTLRGRGTLRRNGCIVSLDDSSADRKVEATANTCQHTGKASVRLFRTGATFAIEDNDTSNNPCLCP